MCYIALNCFLNCQKYFSSTIKKKKNDIRTLFQLQNRTYLVLRDDSGVRGVRISLGSEFDLKELLLDIVALPNLDKFETPINVR